MTGVERRGDNGLIKRRAGGIIMVPLFEKAPALLPIGWNAVSSIQRDTMESPVMTPTSKPDAYPVSEVQPDTDAPAKSTSMKPDIHIKIVQQTGDLTENVRFLLHAIAFILLPLGCFSYTLWRAYSSDEELRKSVAMDPSRAQLVALSLFSRASSISWVAHRLLAHRSFHCVRPFKFLLTVWACSAWSGSPLAWAAKHRVHHKLSDTPEDPEVKYGASFIGRGWGWVFDWRGELNDWHSSWYRDFEPELRLVHEGYLLVVLAELFGVAAVFGWGAAFYGVALPATMWNYFSCGFFAHAHAQGYALTMRYDLFAIAASVVSDEHNHAIHHLFPHWAYSQPINLFSLFLSGCRKLGLVTFVRSGSKSEWKAKGGAARMLQLQRETDSMLHASDFGLLYWSWTQLLSLAFNGWIVWSSDDLVFRCIFCGLFLVFPLDQWGLFEEEEDTDGSGVLDEWMHTAHVD